MVQLVATVGADPGDMLSAVMLCVSWCRVARVLPAAALAVGSGCTDPAGDPADPGTTVSEPAQTETSTTGTPTGAPTEDAGSSSSGDPFTCPTEGGEPGPVLPPVVVTRCDGSSVSLHELACGQPLTLIDIGGAAFQMCVAATDDYATAPEYDDLQARGLQIVQIFALDDENNLPTKSFCADYAEAHAVDFEFLIDQLGATHQLAPEYPFNLVVDGQGSVIHEWSVTIPEDKVEILDALLDEAP